VDAPVEVHDRQGDRIGRDGIHAKEDVVGSNSESRDKSAFSLRV